MVDIKRMTKTEVVLRALRRRCNKLRNEGNEWVGVLTDTELRALAKTAVGVMSRP